MRVATSTYDAFGKQTNRTGTATTNLRYAGQYGNDESGLYWMRARYYDPSTAQFMTRDPIDLITRSAYAYVNNNPLNATDPSGLIAPLVVLGGIWVVYEVGSI